MDLIKRIEWRIYKEIKRMKLKNRNPSIISSNCNGEFIYYDMKLPFLSPTINLSFDMNDYVKFLSNLRWYISQELTPFEDKRFDYPCGYLADIEIRFNHYTSFETAKSKWDERKKRIDWDNLFILAIDGDECSEESIKLFDDLPYEHKVIFTHVKRPDIKSAYYIPGFEKENGVGVVLYFKKQYWIRRYLDDFDYISFLNGKKIEDMK